MNQIDNTVYIGRRIREEWSTVPGIDDDLREHLRTNFAAGEFIEARLHPDTGQLYFLGTNHQTSVQLKLKHAIEYRGNYSVRDMQVISMFWVEEARQKLLMFQPEDKIDLYYYPDYKWLKFENPASGQVEYVTGVVFAIE